MQKICVQCSTNFEVTDNDLVFYEKVSPVFAGKTYQIPPPVHCPQCRNMQRYAYRNERNLYKRICDKTGASIISNYASTQPFPVYTIPNWWGDEWDAMEHGQDIDFNRPFFEQFFELVYNVPKMALVQQGENENSQYTNCVSYNRNCYLIFSANENEDCQYCTFINQSKNCIDGYNVYQSELCAHCCNLNNCYYALYSRDCTNCSDIWFCRGCIGCKNCIGCVNLQNKEYHYFNTPLSKEEYEQKVSSLKSGSFVVHAEMQKKFHAFDLTQPYKYYEGTQNEGSVSGNYVWKTKNVQECYDCEDLEDCKFCTRCVKMKDAYDVSNYGCTQTNELLYNCEGVGHGVTNVCCSKLIWGSSSDILYSFECFSSKHLFGCAGLRKQKYCILNKQYSKEEYENLAGTLAAHMQSTGEWGQFFPANYCPFAYNESIAQDLYPLTHDEALRAGYRWKTDTDDTSQYKKVIQSNMLPDSIDDIPDDVLHWAIQCNVTGRLSLINKRELELYRTLRIPVPRFHPDERHKQRLALHNPCKLWQRSCAKCSKQMQTTYAPDRSEVVYCKECYLQEVY